MGKEIIELFTVLITRWLLYRFNKTRGHDARISTTQIFYIPITIWIDDVRA